MTKKSIALYDAMHHTLSLKKLTFAKNARLEDVFYAVDASNDFDELTQILSGVIANPLTENYREPGYKIVYETQINKTKAYLAFYIEKGEINQ